MSSCPPSIASGRALASADMKPAGPGTALLTGSKISFDRASDRSRMARTAAAYSLKAASLVASAAAAAGTAAGAATGSGAGEGTDVAGGNGVVELPQAAAASNVTPMAPATQASPVLITLTGSSS